MTPPSFNTSPALNGVRIAFVTRRLPTPSGSGSYVYQFALLSALRDLGARIEVWLAEGMLPGVRPVVQVDPALLAIADVHIAGAARVGPVTRRWYGSPADVGASIAKTLFDTMPTLRRLPDGPLARAVRRLDPLGQITREPTAGERRYFAAQRRRFDPHVVLVDTVFLASLHADPDFATVPVRAVLTHDVVFERARNLAKAGIGGELRGWTRDEETRRLRNANAVLAIQPDEARVFGELVGNNNVLVVPMPHDPIRCRSAQTPGRMLFVGSDVEQNVIGIRWFQQAVLPRIRAAIPEASCEVVGSVARSVPRGAGIVNTGFVADLGAHYAAAELVVVPLLAGSGLKIKLVEALAYGRAVVTTSTGLQGVAEGTVPFGIRADSADDFAAACVHLLLHPHERRAMESAAHAWVATHYARDVAIADFVKRIQRALDRAPQAGVVG